MNCYHTEVLTKTNEIGQALIIERTCLMCGKVLSKVETNRSVLTLLEGKSHLTATMVGGDICLK